MAKQANQKAKLLLILSYLERETDEDHPASTQDLLTWLEQNGVSAERKSIYSDLETLSDLGYDVQRQRGPGGGVCLGQRDFELAELKLLVDAVQSSRFITRRKSDALIAKLERLTSRHHARALQRQVYVGDRVKNMNESVYYSVDAIHTAISRGRQITFRYFDYTSKKERRFRHDGKTYRVSPYGLIWDNANYYLVGRVPGEEEPRHYRVDKMAAVSVSDEPADVPRDFDPGAYAGKHFSMFGGKAARVKLRCAEYLAGVILDRFGRETMLIPDADGFTVTLDVVVSQQFWGWLTGLGPDARLVDPPWAKEEYQAYLQALLDQ